jgi:hypothetical protein
MNEKSGAISFEGDIGRISTRADGSLGLTVSTGELTPDQQLIFLKIRQRACVFLIQPKDEPEAELTVVKSDPRVKTPSQRLRSILFVLHQHVKSSEPFEVWYGNYIDRIINRIKTEKLPDLP